MANGNRREVWLRPNRRALLFALIFPLILGFLSAILALQIEGVLRWLAAFFAAFGAALTAALAIQAVRPRLAVCHDQVLLFLRWGAPLAVPLSIVECIFLGRPETQQSLGHASRMVSLVIRLAEAATDYRYRVVKPALGRWEDSYITINGAWCEPLTLELARRLNDLLREAQRRQQCNAPTID
jgi:hypothetical protein